jgi:phospholipid-translocating ATPase
MFYILEIFPVVQRNDWLKEKCGNMARGVLRTLVVGKKRLTEDTYQTIRTKYHAASIETQGRK